MGLPIFHVPRKGQIIMSESEQVETPAEEAQKPADERLSQLEAELKALREDRDKWKAMSRKNEDRAKENAAKAVKFDEISPQFEELARTQMINEVAEAKGIANPGVLRGGTREELEAHADELLELIPAKQHGADVSGVAGNVGDPPTPEETAPTANDLIRAAHRN